jgi:hypothetical protein
MPHDIETLIRQYPVNPTFRRTGPHHLLLWSHHYNRGILTVARTREALMQTWLARWREDEAGTPIAYMKATVVSPPRKYREVFAQQSYRSEVRGFAWWVCDTIIPAYRKKHPVRFPPGTSLCTTYKAQYPSDEPGEHDREHYNCLNCFKKVQADWDGLYEKHKALPQTLTEMTNSAYSRSSYRQSKEKKPPVILTPVEEVEADPTRPLYAIKGGMGWSNPEELDTVFREVTEETYKWDIDRPYMFAQGEIEPIERSSDWYQPVKDAKKAYAQRERNEKERMDAAKQKLAKYTEEMAEQIFGK